MSENAVDFKNVFAALNELVNDGVVEAYALGGATAFLFYAEPVRTYDLDVFVFLPSQESIIFSMNPLYTELTNRGYATKDEHVMMFNTPVQFLPAHNELAVEAVEQARTHNYDGVPVKVIAPEYLIALSLQAGGAKRRIRVEALLEEAADEIDSDKLRSILDANHIQLPID